MQLINNQFFFNILLRFDESLRVVIQELSLSKIDILNILDRVQQVDPKTSCHYVADEYENKNQDLMRIFSGCQLIVLDRIHYHGHH